METRPFYKRLKSLFKRDPKKPLENLTHDYPLPPPKEEVVTVKRRRKRDRFRPCKPSTDPKFHHQLRRTAWLPRLDLASLFGYADVRSRVITNYRKEQFTQYWVDGDKFTEPVPAKIELKDFFEYEINCFKKRGAKICCEDALP